jgi:hypothetical protein
VDNLIQVAENPPEVTGKYQPLRGGKLMVIVRQGNKVILRAKNYNHAINLFASLLNYDLQYAIENDGFTITKEN